MTKKEFRVSVSSIAAKVIRGKKFIGSISQRYKSITFNPKYSMVGLENGFFAQGESADEIIKEVQNLSAQTGLSDKTCLLAYLDSAGALQG